MGEENAASPVEWGGLRDMRSDLPFPFNRGRKGYSLGYVKGRTDIGGD